jgi:hypothetical protein
MGKRGHSSHCNLRSNCLTTAVGIEDVFVLEMFDVFHFQTYVAQQVQTSCNLKNKQSDPGSRTTLFVFMKINRVD